MNKDIMLNKVQDIVPTGIEIVEGEVVERQFYHFSQNNSGGSFDYNGDSGLSVNVYIEAYSADQANQRAEEIGIYFDDTYDCSCCGARWHEVDEGYDTPVDSVPEKDAVLVKDDNNKEAGRVFKWLPEGQFECFVHPLDGEFYGAFAKMKHIKRKITGYGMSFSDRSVGEIVPVGNDGWDQSGNFQAPAPGARSYRSDYTKIVKDTPDLRVQVSTVIGKTYTVWSKDRKTLKEIQSRVQAYLDGIPEMDAMSIIEPVPMIEA